MNQFVSTNLFLLRDELATLARTPFFSKSLESYVNELLRLVERVIDEFASFPPTVADGIARNIWTATRYLKGGTSKAVPFETVYALERALRDWTSHGCAITTALSDDLDYHFSGVDPATAVRAFDPGVKFEIELIQVALPRLYRHRPLYNAALYHELGHYIDTHFRISQLSLLLNPGSGRLRQYSASQVDVLLSHRMEHFADLFAVGYAGVAFSKFLDALANQEPDSNTHPSTAKRLSLTSDFVDGQPNGLVDAFQSALRVVDLPRLEIRFRRPDVSSAFDNIRTYKIHDAFELHGILEAAWLYLEDAERRDRHPWSGIPPHEIGQIINDLVEKSIRNYITVLKWAHGNHQREIS